MKSVGRESHISMECHTVALTWRLAFLGWRGMGGLGVFGIQNQHGAGFKGDRRGLNQLCFLLVHPLWGAQCCSISTVSHFFIFFFMDSFFDLGDLIVDYLSGSNTQQFVTCYRDLVLWDCWKAHIFCFDIGQTKKGFIIFCINIFF